MKRPARWKGLLCGWLAAGIAGSLPLMAGAGEGPPDAPARIAGTFALAGALAFALAASRWHRRHPVLAPA